ncbi:unnamed protein product [Acanthoscelides obtectus]|uniref:10 kDa heat shock protein, mitochondrial n=1 Tax=Acanthoscelides obtectus TaxID=200917 RepID=A0A9P0L9J2_ACAOB|nr:unnamed protein product [Acanthoscelides obtectus]CAK1638884.1 10 kDa heat shock protein, mitochondrial [Acanthoscelides obtectus]
MAAAALPKVVAQFKKIAPLANRVLIKKADPITQTKGGIVLPDQTKTRIHRGTAIAVGPGGRNDNGQVIPMQGGIVIPENTKERIRRGYVVATGPGARGNNGEKIPMSVKPGDEVLLPDYGATKLELGDDEVYYIYRETEILAKINE